jgi:putative Mg2+ transporter-C (MgtC) family protein
MIEYLIGCLEFTGYVAAALLLGAALGLERQYRGHPAGLRTNALVSIGAALFVSLSWLIGEPNSPTRMASYVVSGIGFLGGGVILREGLNVRGMNTAATLWCSGAVGALCGSGFVPHAVLGTVLILAVHLALRPLAHRLDVARKSAVDMETVYRVRVVCEQNDQAVVRAILLRHINSKPNMTVQGIATQECDHAEHLAVTADIYSLERADRVMEELVHRLDIEPSVIAISWERKP